MLGYIIGFSIVEVICALIVYILVTFFREGTYRLHKAIKPKSSEYLIKTTNKIEIQEYNQCAGFSCAYVMRHFGRNVTGEEIYSKMPHLKNGTILPKHIVSLFRAEGFDAEYYRGSLDTLKGIIEQGDPVIVFINSSLGSNILHFVTVVGFDKENIFIVDSLENNINEPSENYNRRLSNEDFLKLWNTARFVMPLHKNIFIKVKVKP